MKSRRYSPDTGFSRAMRGLDWDWDLGNILFWGIIAISVAAMIYVIGDRMTSTHVADVEAQDARHDYQPAWVS